MKLVRVLALLFLGAALASCGPVPVDGLFFSLQDGSGLPVLARKADAVKRLEGKESPLLRFSLQKALIAEGGVDLALRADTDAELRLKLYATAKDLYDKDALPLLSAALAAPLQGSREYRVPLAAGLGVQYFSLELSGGSYAELLGFALLPGFSGYLAEGPQGYPVLGAGLELIEINEAGAYSISMARPSGADASLLVSLEAPGELRLHGGARYAAAMDAGASLAVPAMLFSGDRLTLSSGSPIKSAAIDQGKGAPLSDLHAILLSPAFSGNYALFRWDLLPHTLVFDFKDYDVQDRYFKRLAFFAEKPGFRGRLAPDREIAALHAWNAHDYPTATLAAFYELARTTAFPLNAEETELLELLLRHGVLERQGDAALREGKGAIISVARESPDWQRRTFMDHEASHALFFQDEEYRTLAEGLWDALGQESRQFWLEHLAWRNYDVSHKYLNYNELQAYLVQQSVSRVEAYLGDNVLVRLAAAYPQQAQRYAADKARILRDALADAGSLDRYLRERWGLRAGAFGRLRKSP
jgi:hypothetical protein